MGTGFDLNELTSDPLVMDGTVDLGEIRFIRVTDIVGDGDTEDSFGNPIFDPDGAGVVAAGFDLDAIGVINAPEPGAVPMLTIGGLAVFALAFRRRNGIS